MTDEDGTERPGDRQENPEPNAPDPPPRKKPRIIHGGMDGLSDEEILAKAKTAEADEKDRLQWPGGRNKSHELVGNYFNARAALQRVGLYSFNLFRARYMIERDDIKTPFNDHLFNGLYDKIVLTFRLNVKVDVVRQAMKGLSVQHQYHPVREYLTGLHWDGQPRIDNWLAVAFGAAAENELVAEYISMVGRLTLLAAVRRIRNPGSKFDTAPVLVGPQGIGKSKALRILAVRHEWFADQLILSEKAQTQIEQMDGKWIYELSELEGLKRADTPQVKSFMSRQFDNARAAYGHFAEERGRQNVFIGTTNDLHFLKDTTGNRRWWPVTTTRIDLDWMRNNVHQLWAEAVAMEKELPLTDEALELPQHLWPVANAEQEKRMVEDAWLGKLRDLKPEKGKSARYFSVFIFDEILRLNPAKEFDPWHHLARLMRGLGFEGPKDIRIGNEKRSGFFYPNETDKDPENPPPAAQAAADEAARAEKAAEEAAANNDAKAAEQAARDAQAAADRAALIAKHAVRHAEWKATEAKAAENDDDGPL